jgi:hypothetical protein
MAAEIRRLIDHANDLQEAVDSMLLLEFEHRQTFIQFLQTLHDRDFHHLMELEFDQKVLYLERRFAMHRGRRNS